jgi:hypothetical protein
MCIRDSFRALHQCSRIGLFYGSRKDYQTRKI